MFLCALLALQAYALPQAVLAVPPPSSVSAVISATPIPSSVLSSASSAPSIASAGAYPHPPAGGVGVSPTDPPPNYTVTVPFDGDSLQLVNMQEWIELDLFHHGLAVFSEKDFDAAGIDARQRHWIQVWAEQEVGHATAVNNLLREFGQVQQCNYTYPFLSVKEFISFSRVLTRWGEAGVYGFLPHLAHRDAAQILLQAITTEARQQEGLSQMQGLFPTPFWFNMGLPQAYAWSLLVQYVTSCPESNPRINFNIFPLIHVQNQPNYTHVNLTSHVSNNVTASWKAGDEIHLNWESTGIKRGPPEQGGYVTAISPTAEEPKFVAFIHQLNVTYTPLNVTGNNSGSTTFPDFRMFESPHGPNVNGTVFIALTDDEVPLTPYNLSLINDHTLAVGWLEAL